MMRLSLEQYAPVLTIDLDAVLAVVVYAGIGLGLFAGFWLIIVRSVPFSVRKEIEDDQNTALGIILGAVIIGMAMNISAAVGG